MGAVRTSRSRSLCLSLLGAVLVTACGSTVQGPDSVASGDVGIPAGSELGGSEAGVPAAGSGTLSEGQGTGSTDGETRGTAGGAFVPGAPGTQPPPEQAPGGSDPDPATRAETDVKLGPGVDAKTITIGLTIQKNNSTVSSLADAYNVTLADDEGAYRALIKHINAHGGVAGRQLKPIYHRYDTTSSNAAQIGQAACSAFTEDNKVFAAVDTLTEDTFNTCMQQRGRVMLQYGLFLGSGKTTWDRYPNVVAAEGLPFDVAGRLLAEHLARTGFFVPSSKIGAIIRSSDDHLDAYRGGFVPALAGSGLKVAEAHFIRDAQGASDISGYTSDISSAVLKFRQNGIDRVVFFDTGSYSAVVFTQNAEQQAYRPRYGFSSINGIVTLQGGGSPAPQEQMVGAQGISWETGADALAKAKTPSAKQCLAILKDAGVPMGDAGTEASYLKTCQAFFLFKAAADNAGRNLNRDTFIASVAGLGSGFSSTNTWDGKTRFGTGDHSGASVFRPFVYSEECSCFEVTGGNQPVGAS